MEGETYAVQYFICGNLPLELSDEDWREHQQRVIRMQKIVGGVRGNTGIQGLRLDFNLGLRLQIPAGNWHVRIRDYDTERIFYESDVSSTMLISWEKYYIHWDIVVSRDGEIVFSHVFDPQGHDVQIVHNAVGAMGDTLSYLPYIRAFRDKHQAKVFYSVPKSMKLLAARFLPDIPQREWVGEDTYATYVMGMGFDGGLTLPLDGRSVPLYHVPMLALGLERPAASLPWKRRSRSIRSVYVCIGVQASLPSKGWLWEGGWDEVVCYLKSLGYRVLCIDRASMHEGRGLRIARPEGAEDFTGDISLVERADMLAHADFFVGLGSGLAWLAHMVGCPVVMISGFSAYWYEFPEAYRVYNRFVCNGCMNDQRVEYYKDWFCPRHADDPQRELECSRNISPRQVIQAIDQLMEDLGKRCLP